MRQFLFAITLACITLPNPAMAQTDCNTVIADLARNVSPTLGLEAMVTTNTTGTGEINSRTIATATIVFALSSYQVRSGRPLQGFTGLQGEGVQYFSNRFAPARGPFSGQTDGVVVRIIPGNPAHVALISGDGSLIWSGAPQCEERGIGIVGLMHGLSDDGTLAFTVSVMKHTQSAAEGPFHN